MSRKRQPHIHISPDLYDLALERLSEQHFTNARIGIEDYFVCQDDAWLMDSAVAEEVVRRDGMWCIYLIFLNPLQPLQFCRRFIVKQVQKKKAFLMANFMRRLAAKDQRGTIRVPTNRYQWEYN